MTRNQAAMALNKVKRIQKQAAVLEQFVDASGDALDKEDEEYLSMQSSVNECAARIRHVKKMLESYAREKLSG